MSAFRLAAYRTGAFAMFCMIVAGALWSPFMPTLEGKLFPVTSFITPIDVVASGSGLDFRFSYIKNRFCEYLGVTARDDTGHLIDFDTVVDTPVIPSKLPGARTSRLWHLNSPTLDGISIFYVHRCSPLWLTVTQVFSPEYWAGIKGETAMPSTQPSSASASMESMAP